MGRYHPTPAGLNRDAAAVLHVLANAHAQLDGQGVAPATESTGAGSMYSAQNLPATGDDMAIHGRLVTLGGRTTPPPVEPTAGYAKGTHATVYPHR